jgi:outer membrane protein assembly factor BamB
MRARVRCGLLALLAATLAACSSGSSSPTCSFDDAGVLAASSPWPKFHHDSENTGTVANANLSSNPGTCRWVFPPGDVGSCTTALSTSPKGAFAAAPVINSMSGDAKRIYIGSADGTLYALGAENGTQISSFTFSIAGPISCAALVATRPNEGEVVFIGGSNGYLYGLTDSGVAQSGYWPSGVGGIISGSLSIGSDGTVYAASLIGLFAGVCPNGIERFALLTTGSLYSPAQGTDGTLYFGGDDHLLRAMQPDGKLKWSFSAAAPILAAPVFDADTNSVYVADRSGRVFKVETDGRPDENFAFGPVGPIFSSPAVAGDHLYFGSDDGNVYAVNTTTGSTSTEQADWTFHTEAGVFSSPAVATNAGSPAIVVIGSDDGNVYFLEDDGPSVTLLATFSIGAPIRSSPAIDSDGTVYVGADDGRVYAIGSPLPSATPTPLP